MPKRFTDSEKWKDPWFRKLTPAAKLMCLYLYDRCDIAGFWEIDLEAAAFEIGIKYNDVLGAMKDLERAYETNGDYIWIKRFVRFQGNKDLNENNKAHLGIIRILTEKEGFSKNVSRVLNRQELPSSFEGPSKGLFSPTSISKGKGKGKGKGKEKGLYTSTFTWLKLCDLCVLGGNYKRRCNLNPSGGGENQFRIAGSLEKSKIWVSLDRWTKNSNILDSRFGSK